MVSLSAQMRPGHDVPLINPMKGRHSPDVGPTAVMAATAADLECLSRLLGFQADTDRSFFNSRLFADNSRLKGISLAGPFTGAPHAVILLENLIAWGARQIIFLGWCGSLSETVVTGDKVLPTGAIADEGTSPHYIGRENKIAYPSRNIQYQLREALASRDQAFHEGLIWSMDAIYRETPEKMALMQQRRAMAVEMELSALFNVGQFRNVDVGALLVVSDELASLRWNPGFGSKHFKKSRQTACEVIGTLCQNLSPGISSGPSKT
jgi:uridine phosphorylase